MEPITTYSSTLLKSIGKISKTMSNYHQFYLKNAIRNTVITLGIRRQKMYIPYQRSREGTIINKIRTMIRSNGMQFSNRETSTRDSFRSKRPDYGNLIYMEKTSATGIKQHAEKK